MILKHLLLSLLLTAPLIVESVAVAASTRLNNPVAGQQPTLIGQSDRQTALPQATRTAILRDMAKRTLIPATQLRITQIQPATFNGCLDVAPRDGVCPMIALPGWRVTVQGEQYRWVYHAVPNQQPKLNGFASVPRSITQAALRDAARRARIPVAQLAMNWVEQKTWNDGCLGLPTNGGCTAAMVPGWQVTIAHGQNRWVYRTDSGNTVRFDRSASRV